MLSKPEAQEYQTRYVHFKHKHITAPSLTPEDTIVKAISDLTEALKERRNTKDDGIRCITKVR
jgi:hypothetical protein